MTAARTIILKGDPIRKERAAGGTITPGDLIELMSTGAMRRHSTAAGNAQSSFALEDDLQGNEIGDDYSSGQRVQMAVFHTGMEVNARLKASENVAIGDLLESAGDGTLRKMALDSTSTYFYNQLVAIALEASNVGTVARIAVEII